MSTAGTIKRRTLLTGTNNPAYQVSKDAYNDSLIVASAAPDGTVLVRDSANGDGWGLTEALALPVGASGASTFLQAKLSDTGAVGHYNFAVGHATNAGDAGRDDHVLTVGYNTTPLGGRANTAEPCFEWRIEDYYIPSATPFLEAHWQYYDATGAGYRPIACQINRTNGGYLTDATIAFQGTSISFLAANGTQYFKYEQAQLSLLNGAIMSHNGNNVQWIRQFNAANTHMNSLIYTDASDRVLIGDGSAGGTTHYWLYSSSSTPRMGWGGMTASYPALARNGAILETKLADDSAYATHAALTFKTMTALVALGGGATPTLGTIGGSGPATAAQNTWLKMLDSTGAAFWVPAWK